ncbi:MAG TPA: hypothetical protein VFS18_02065, partial [Actinomycetota bacterium]|nr:hypothetical protein [Actinomycetota bacterium]
PDTDPSPNGLLGRIERLERRMGISEDAASAGSVAPARAAVAPPAAAAPQEGAAPAQEAAPAVAPGPSKRTRSRPKKEPRGEPAVTDIAPAAESMAPDPSAEPERAVSPAASPPGVPAEIGLAHLKDAWHATMGEVGKRSKRIQGYLNPSRPVQFEEGTLLIEVQSAFHEATMTEERNRSVLTDALHSALGIKPALRFVARGAAPAPAEDHGGGEADYVEAASEPGEAHDPVELVKKGLGAEVVEERTPS